MRILGMPQKPTYDEAGKVSAEDGVVHLDGPDGVDVRLTADAAEEVSDRLMDGVLEARGQLFFANKKKPRRN